MAGHEGQLAAKAETIAALRRRAEAAEAALALPRDLAPKGDEEASTTVANPEASAGLWARVGRWWHG